MRVAAREANDFVFDGWAIAGASGFDLAVVHGGAIEVCEDEIVGGLAGAC